jgi:hypothetical protein
MDILHTVDYLLSGYSHEYNTNIIISAEYPFTSLNGRVAGSV